MIIMTLNDSAIVPISGYNRYTEIREGKVYSNANITLASIDSYNGLVQLSEDPIASIEIKVDGNKIYELRNQNGKISSINEYLNEGTMSLNMTISFSNTEEEAEEEAV